MFGIFYVRLFCKVLLWKLVFSLLGGLWGGVNFDMFVWCFFVIGNCSFGGVWGCEIFIINCVCWFGFGLE